MRLAFTVLCLLALTTCTYAQQNYDVSLIPKNLLPYASAVVRNQEVSIEVKDLTGTNYHIKEAITVLNKNGDEMAHIQIEHNKSLIIKSIKGAIYNEFGKQTGKFSESDFEDVSSNDGFSLFQDVKVKHYEPAVTGYPYTIEYEYDLRLKQTLNFPGWEPNAEIGTAVEKSSFTFTCKPDFNIRYKEINMPSGVSIATVKDGLKTYTWQINNLKAIKNEPYIPNSEKYLSLVKIAPDSFEYEGISGSFTNWSEFGKWMYDKILANRQNISPETTQHIMEITSSVNDPKLKARKIYEYMQGKTRYVNVSIGIGGIQPLLASDVDKLNYGDCKALVNYTRALLKIVGIDSYYCEAVAGSECKVSLLNDFASRDQANHAILCIPFRNDTTWADCTSQTLPFGYLGDFTDDRTVIAFTPEGGKLIHTPKYTPENSLQARYANFVIDGSGALSGNMTTTFKGWQYETRENIIAESPTEQFKAIAHIYAINNMAVEKLEFKQDKSLQPVTTENIKLTAPEYASTGDGKIYFMVNAVNRRLSAPREVRNRTLDVYINEGFTDIDDVKYTVPAGYHLDANPLNVTLHKPFGNFTATIVVNGNEITYNRKLQVIDGTYPKDTYQDLVDFYQAVTEADAYDVRLVKNN